MEFAYPFVLKARKILQKKLWKLNLGLDDEISLYLFSDASKDGFGMCAYLRLVYASGNVWCSFLVGRSRSFHSQAWAASSHIISEEIPSAYGWADMVTFLSDYQTTLHYVNNKTMRFQTYMHVANRVTDICKVTSPETFLWKGWPSWWCFTGLEPSEIL